jgi:hypothetical protein
MEEISATPEPSRQSNSKYETGRSAYGGVCDDFDMMEIMTTLLQTPRLIST